MISSGRDSTLTLTGSKAFVRQASHKLRVIYETDYSVPINKHN